MQKDRLVGKQGNNGRCIDYDPWREGVHGPASQAHTDESPFLRLLHRFRLIRGDANVQTYIFAHVYLVPIQLFCAHVRPSARAADCSATADKSLLGEGLARKSTSACGSLWHAHSSRPHEKKCNEGSSMHCTPVSVMLGAISFPCRGCSLESAKRE